MNKNLKILVVDDFPDMRRVIRNMLLQLGFSNITEADDGMTALPMLKGGTYDLLITDWNMPGMQGIDLLRYVRADENLKLLPVLMVTSEQKEEQIDEAKSAGVNGYILKPFSVKTLEENLKSIFNNLDTQAGLKKR